MDVNVNGKQRSLDGDASVGDLLRQLDLAPVRVAVEVNKDLVKRSRYDETVLRDGDSIEIVTFVGGG